VDGRQGVEVFRELLGAELAGRGYAVAVHGEVQWNGVAVLTRVGLEDVVSGLAGALGFPPPEADADVFDPTPTSAIPPSPWRSGPPWKTWQASDGG
jgi:hypothetical protein